jgi:hypothetical protein
VNDAQTILTEAGLLPRAMPINHTFDRVRAILLELEDGDQDKLRAAVALAEGLKIRGPLAAVIFIKHHLDGAHEVEVDRIAESAEGTRYAVLIYKEGELAVPLECVPRNIEAGSRLRYDPNSGLYREPDRDV